MKFSTSILFFAMMLAFAACTEKPKSTESASEPQKQLADFTYADSTLIFSRAQKLAEMITAGEYSKVADKLCSLKGYTLTNLTTDEKKQFVEFLQGNDIQSATVESFGLQPQEKFKFTFSLNIGKPQGETKSQDYTTLTLFCVKAGEEWYFILPF